MLVYDTAPPLPHIGDLTRSMVDELTALVTHHLRRWGVSRRRQLRARVLVITALRLVHDVVIRTEPGRQRTAATGEVTRLVRRGLAPD